jgi:hypothetical protein
MPVKIGAEIENEKERSEWEVPRGTRMKMPT